MKNFAIFTLCKFVIVLGMDYRGKPCLNPIADGFNGALVTFDKNGAGAQEVHFSRTSKTAEEELCKIICEDGEWIGPLCSADIPTSLKPNVSCIIPNIPSNLTLSSGGKVINEVTSKEFSDGTLIKAHCEPPQYFKRKGPTSVVCNQGEWSDVFPECKHSNHFVGIQGDSYPPSFMWTVAGGAGEIDHDGSLVLLPKSILHLDCLFPRIEGNPSWEWSSMHRNYPTGWAIDQSEREKHYRLSIYYADPKDSGSFRCISPKGFENFIDIVVKDVKCKELKVAASSKLQMPKKPSFLLGANITFSCPRGYQLVGSSQLKCFPSGNWSSNIPHCEVVKCHKLRLNSQHVIVHSLDSFYSGKARFGCPKGYTLEGEDVITCTANGTWTNKPPFCKEIICPDVKPPTNGQLQIIGGGRMGSTLVFTCHPGFILRGHIVSFCTANGKWSHRPPKCDISCSHPGRPQNGRLMPRLHKYKVGYVALVSCYPGYRPAGPDRIKCLETRRWSSPLTHCVPSLGLRNI